MEIIKAKMKSLTKSFGEETATVLNYKGQECILISNQNRQFVFNSDEGKLFVFISNDSKTIKEKHNDNEIEIEFSNRNIGKLKMTKRIGTQKLSAKFNVVKEVFKVDKDLIHIKYKIFDDDPKSYLSEVEIFIEIGGN